MYFLTVCGIHAQTSLFEEGPSGTVLTSGEQQKLDETLQYEPNVQSSKVVAVNPIEQFLVGSNGVQTNIPGIANSVLFTTDFVSIPFTGNHFWIGYTSTGSMMTLGRNSNGSFVSIVYAPTNQYFKITSLSASRSLLLRVASPPSNGPDECATAVLPDDDTDTTVTERDCRFNVVRDLFLFTTAAGTLSTMTSGANTVISELNASTAASGLLPISITFQLAAVLPMPTGFAETADIIADLFAAKTTSGIATLRATNFADIVVFITASTHHGVAGVSDAIAASSPKAFCMVEAPFLTGPAFSGCHEIGHVIGTRHQRFINCPTGTTILGIPTFSGDELTLHHGSPRRCCMNIFPLGKVLFRYG